MSSNMTEGLALSCANNPLPEVSWPSTTGVGWTGVKLPSFDRFFTKLPPELRARVWSFYIPEARVLELEPNPTCDQIITRHKTPAYLHACNEARFEGLKIYEPLGGKLGYCYDEVTRRWRVDGERPPYARILINFELDTILFTSAMFVTHEAVTLASKGMRIKLDKILNLGIHFLGCQRSNSFNEDILRCSALQKLYMEFSDHAEVERIHNMYLLTEGEEEMIPTEVLVAGQPCIQYNVPAWRAHQDLMLTDFLQYGHFEASRLESAWERVTSCQRVDYLGAASSAELDAPHTAHPELISFHSTFDERRAFPNSANSSVKLTFDKIFQIYKKDRDTIQEIKNSSATNISFTASFGFGESSQLITRKTASKELRKCYAEIYRARSRLIRNLGHVIHRLRMIRSSFEECAKEKYGWSELLTNKFTSRYINLGIKYFQRGGSKQYFQSADDCEFRSTWKTGHNDYDSWSWHHGALYQQRKKDDPSGKAKRRIMSRRGLGRPFLFRTTGGENARKPRRCVVPGGVKNAVRQLGKRKLRGAIVVRKRPPSSFLEQRRSR